MKLRKILVLTLTLLMVLSCTAFAVAETRPLKVALLLTSNLGDKGFYDSAAHGLKLIGEAFPGSETKCVEMGQDPSVYESNICDIAESGYDYIIERTERVGGDTITKATLKRWIEGQTYTPHLSKLNAVLNACGYQLSLVKK